jgi:hypothetical protein
MSIAIRSFYLLTQAIKQELENDPSINTVSFGDITELDLRKQTMFPLAHIMLNSVTNRDNVLVYNLSVFVMDVVDTSKSQTTDWFVGNDNEQDVLNTCLVVINKLATKLRKGALFINKYQLDADVVFEPFVERFDNSLAGFVGTFDILVTNDIDIC